MVVKFIANLIVCCFLDIAVAQTAPNLIVKASSVLAGQKANPKLFSDGGRKVGFAGGLEYSILAFGNKKQFEASVDLSFIQKGAYNIAPVHSFYYDQFGNIQSAGVGSQTYRININYLSVTPMLKYNFWKNLYLKGGLRGDIFWSYKVKENTVDTKRGNNDFTKFTPGVSYGLGICLGKKQVQYISEVMAQNDFLASSFNPLTNQYYVNSAYFATFGILINLKPKR